MTGAHALIRLVRPGKRRSGPARWQRLAVVAAVLPLALAACTRSSGSAGSSSSSAPASFAGKTVTLVVPTSAGGGLDGLARAVSKYLGDYLPGQPKVIVDNIDGGGGAVGLHQLYSTMPASGLYVGLVQSPQLLRYVFKATGFNFDMTKFVTLGSLRDGSLVTTSKKAGTNVKTLAASTTPVVIGNADPGGIGGLEAALGFKVLKIPYKMVFGYSGTGPIGLAMVRNDVGAATTTYAGFLQTFQPEGNLAFYQTGYPSSDGGMVRDTSGSEANVPTVEDLYKQAYGTAPSGSDYEMYKTVATLSSLGTAFVVRPGTPANFTKALTDGLAKMATNSGAKAGLSKLLGHSPGIIGPSATQQVEQDYYGLSDATISQLKVISGLTK